MRHLSLKRYGTDDQPLILDFDINQTNEAETHFNASDLEMTDYRGLIEAAQYFMDKPEKYAEPAWIALHIHKSNMVYMQIGFSFSKWRFIKPFDLFECPSIFVSPCIETREHRYKFQSDNYVHSNIKSNGTLKSTPWIDLTKKLYSKRILVRFPAVVSVAGPPRFGRPTLNLEAKLPTYSELFLFLRKLDLI